MNETASPGPLQTIKTGSLFVIGINTIMPVLFGDILIWNSIQYWGILKDVHFENGKTLFTVGQLRQVKEKHTAPELVLRSTGKNIGQFFVRDYSICYTPEFLGDWQ